MRSVLRCSLVAALLCMPYAIATPHPQSAALSAYFGNTLEMRSQAERLWIFLNADGSWDGIFSGRFHAGKNWTLERGRACFFNSGPPSEPETQPSCFDGLSGRKLGEQWTLVKVGESRQWHASLTEGRQLRLDPSSLDPSANASP